MHKSLHTSGEAVAVEVEVMVDDLVAMAPAADSALLQY
jgi:hypothetical protein